MWFGNYVTIEWWTHLWLKEGFAMFMQYVCMDGIDSQDKANEQAYTGQLFALQLDSLKNSHPVQVEVNHPREASEVFDKISYYKGQSLIKMFYSWIGDENFKLGITKYLNQYAYQSCETFQLWKCLEEVMAEKGLLESYPIDRVGKFWTDHQNFPLVEAELPESEPGKVRLTQRSCLEDDPTIWPLPLCLRSETQEQRILFESKSINLNYDKFMLLNQNFNSFCRVKYSDPMYADLFEHHSQNLSYVDANCLQNDYFYFNKQSYLQFIRKYYTDSVSHGYIDSSCIKNILKNLETIKDFPKVSYTESSANGRLS